MITTLNAMLDVLHFYGGVSQWRRSLKSS